MHLLFINLLIINKVIPKTISKSKFFFSKSIVWSFLLIPFFFTSIDAQNTTKPIQDWELGLFFGAGLLSGDLVTDANSFNATGEPAFGINIQRNLNTSLSLRALIFHTNLKSSDKKSDVAAFINRGFSHETKLTEVSLVGQWDILGKLRFKKPGEFKKIISPYIFGGIGFTIGSPNTDYNDVENPLIIADQNSIKEYRFVYPFGGGLKLELNRNFSVSLETGFRPTFEDLLDGVSKAGNPNQDDWYNFTGLVLNYRFGQTDYDGDGLADVLDACPGEFGNKDFGIGCPDKDGDFIIDSLDECPETPGKRVLLGCPDLDHDGVPDKRDLCPNEKGLFRFLGCPDTDGDNIIDSEDLCPKVAGSLAHLGCPDSDNDGIIDKDDDCPNSPGDPKMKGCLDSDLDGISDLNDECPEEEGLEKFSGCPDTDGDGIMDKNDDCPLEFGKKENGGCKGIKKQDKEVLLVAVENINFETGKYYLSNSSKKELEKILKLFPQYPDYQLLIKGYTDNIGRSKINQVLSEKRARSCYRFFLKNGIPDNRLAYFGYGEVNPRASNETKEGREENRRVEFELVPK